MHIAKKLIPLCAVAASLTGVVWAAAAPASAAPVYVPNPAISYQFASNTGGPGLTGSNDTYWKVSNSPLSYTQASQSLGANGVGLSVTPPSSTSPYADSGVIVPLGTIASSGLQASDGSLNLPNWAGTSNVKVNIYFDTNGDGQPFAFNSDGVYEGTNGDTYVTTGNQPIPASTVTTDENPTQGADTHIWAWFGIDSTTAGQTSTGYVSSVNNTPLVTTSGYAAPVTGLKVTAGYTSLTATWNASSAATKYQVMVTQHNGSLTVGGATVTGTSARIGNLTPKNTYAVKVLAEPAAPGQNPTVVYSTTK